jgi:hypothetical protein
MHSQSRCLRFAYARHVAGLRRDEASGVPDPARTPGRDEKTCRNRHLQSARPAAAGARYVKPLSPPGYTRRGRKPQVVDSTNSRGCRGIETAAPAASGRFGSRYRSAGPVTLRRRPSRPMEPNRRNDRDREGQAFAGAGFDFAYCRVISTLHRLAGVSYTAPPECPVSRGLHGRTVIALTARPVAAVHYSP